MSKQDLAHKNLGRFFIKKEYVNGQFEKVREVLGQMVVIEARYSPERDVFDYVAICKLFEAVRDGTSIPSYALSFKDGQLVAEKVS